MSRTIRPLPIGLLVVFVVIGVVFFISAAYWNWIMSEQEIKELIKLDTTGFSKNLVDFFFSFFIAMGIIFLVLGLILYLMSFEYEWRD